jgi:hypothetical protein
MSISVTGISNLSTAYDPDETSAAPKAPAKVPVAKEVSQMAEDGNSAAQIAAQLGLSTDIVDEDLGETSSTSTSTGAASALVAASARLSVSA